MQGAFFCSKSMPGVDVLKTLITQWGAHLVRTHGAGCVGCGSPAWHWQDGSSGTTLARLEPAWNICAHRESNPGHNHERPA